MSEGEWNQISLKNLNIATLFQDLALSTPNVSELETTTKLT